MSVTMKKHPLSLYPIKETKEFVANEGAKARCSLADAVVRLHDVVMIHDVAG
jgi:hypothetical protein